MHSATNFNHVGFGLGRQVPMSEQITRPDGTRLYQTTDGRRYPSVTTILQEHGREAIEAWRKRIGTEEASQKAIQRLQAAGVEVVMGGPAVKDFYGLWGWMAEPAGCERMP